MNRMEHILVIGGGVGGAVACDLAMRGFRVTLVEKGELLSGTTGRHHGLLHSGARYVLHDPEVARECFRENQILKRIAPHAIEPNGGLFIALDEKDENDEKDAFYQQAFLEGCRSAGIPSRKLATGQALAMEPNLTPKLEAAFQVPDAVMDAFRLAMSFFAAAKASGARIKPFCEVVKLNFNNRTITGAQVRNHGRETSETIGADMVINCAGPWAGRIAALAGINVPVRPVPGVMVSVGRRLTQRVINRLHPAGEGDIVLPQRRLSILGTTAWQAEDPDAENPEAEDPDLTTVPADHVKRLFEWGARLIPELKSLPPHAVWCASRPLLDTGNGKDPFSASRSFACIDHGQDDGVEGLITLAGGKATTMRAMAEKTVDLVCRKTGRGIACRTRTTVLPSHRYYWHNNFEARMTK